MKFLDKVALNRLVSIILGFVLSLIKLFHVKVENIDIPEESKPIRKPWWRRKKSND